MATTNAAPPADPGGPRRFDHDLDVPAAARGARRNVDRREYQRLVANPFLGFAVFLMGFGLLLQGAIPRNFALQWAGGTLIASAFCLQYQCLDCGRVGQLFRWRSHACERVLDRERTRSGRPRLGPTPTAQAILLAWLVGAIALVTFVASIRWP